MLSSINCFSQSDYYQMIVNVKVNIQNEWIVVQSIKTDKKFWIKDVEMEESKEYEILIKVPRDQDERIFGTLLFYEYSARQKALNLRKIKDSIKKNIITNY